MSRDRSRRLVAVANEIEQTFLSLCERYSLRFLRYSLVVVFVWFGVLTATGIGETAELVAAATGVVSADYFQVAFGSWEVVIGLALLYRRTVRLAVVLVVVQTMISQIPLLLFPGETFTYFPYGPSFEGVYIIKNWVLLGGVMTVGGSIGRTGE